MKDRMTQVNELIQRTLAEIFSQTLEIPFEYFVSVTRVSCSSDLKTARVFLSVLPFAKARDGLVFIIRNKNHIQKLLGEKINIKFTPILHYCLDDSEEKASKVYEVIDAL